MSAPQQSSGDSANLRGRTGLGSGRSRDDPRSVTSHNARSFDLPLQTTSPKGSANIPSAVACAVVKSQRCIKRWLREQDNTSNAFCRRSPGGSAGARPFLFAAATATWLYGILRMVWETPNPLIDADTQLLFTEALDPEYTWAERFDIWATTPHPMGVLLQQAYLRSFATLGLGPESAWKVLLIAIVVFTTIIFAARSWAMGLALVMGLYLFPSLRYQLATWEEEALGMLLFLFSIFSIAGAVGDRDHVGPAPGDSRLNLSILKTVRHTLPTAVLVSGTSLWHFQYWFVLTQALGLVLFMRLLVRRKRNAVLEILFVSLTFLMPVLHFSGAVHYRPYHQTFQSLWREFESGGGWLSWLMQVLKGFSEWSLPPSQGASWATAGPSIVLLASLVIVIWKFRNSYYQKDFWFALVLAAGTFPALYEPSSSERWVPLWIVILSLLMTISHQALNDVEFAATPSPKSRQARKSQQRLNVRTPLRRSDAGAESFHLQVISRIMKSSR